MVNLVEMTKKFENLLKNFRQAYIVQKDCFTRFEVISKASPYVPYNNFFKNTFWVTGRKLQLAIQFPNVQCTLTSCIAFVLNKSTPPRGILKKIVWLKSFQLL